MGLGSGAEATGWDGEDELKTGPRQITWILKGHCQNWDFYSTGLGAIAESGAEE